MHLGVFNVQKGIIVGEELCQAPQASSGDRSVSLSPQGRVPNGGGPAVTACTRGATTTFRYFSAFLYVRCGTHDLLHAFPLTQDPHLQSSVIL